MVWNEGHTWSLDMQLPVGSVSFKVVMEDQNSGGHVRWEDGGDRTIDLPAAISATTTTTTAAGVAVPISAVGVACPWGATHATEVRAIPDKDALRVQLEAIEARVAALRQKRQRVGKRAAAALSSSAAGAPLQLTLPLPNQAPAAGSATPSSAPSSSAHQQVQVPLIDSSDLPPIRPLATPTSAAMEPDMAAAEARFNRLLSEITGESTLAAAAGSALLPAAGEGDDVVVEESLSERVLGATVDSLLAAAQDALRSGRDTSALGMGSTESDALRAAAYLGELQVQLF